MQKISSKLMLFTIVTVLLSLVLQLVLNTEAQNQASFTMQAIDSGTQTIDKQKDTMRQNKTASDQATEAINHLSVVTGDIVTSFEKIAKAVSIINEKVNTTAHKAYNVNKNANNASKQMNEVAEIAASTSQSVDIVSANAKAQAEEVSSIDLYIKGVSELIESLGESVKRFNL